MATHYTAAGSMVKSGSGLLRFSLNLMRRMRTSNPSSSTVRKKNLFEDGKHWKAWGIVHKDGLPPADTPKKISGVHKRCWRYIPNLPKIEAAQPPETEAA